MENKAPKELHRKKKKKKGLGNMTKNALFMQKFDLCLKILPANNNLDSARDKAGLADGRTEEKLTGESAIPKKILLQYHNNLINKQTNHRYLQSQSLASTKTKRHARGRGAKIKVIVHRLGVF